MLHCVLCTIVPVYDVVLYVVCCCCVQKEVESALCASVPIQDVVVCTARVMLSET